jgi:hypothetical protein
MVSKHFPPVSLVFVDRVHSYIEFCHCRARELLVPSGISHTCYHIIRAALHLEVGPISLEANCMKVQLLLGWRPASTTHYNITIITGANFSHMERP